MSSGKTYKRMAEGYAEPYDNPNRLIWAERIRSIVQCIVEILSLFQSSLYLYTVQFALAGMGVQRRRGRGFC